MLASSQEAHSSSSFIRWCLLVVFAFALGCGPVSTKQSLVGQWQGRPDTAAARRDRSRAAPPAEATGVALTEEEQEEARVLAQAAPLEADLEKVPVEIGLQFNLDGSFKGWLGGDAQADPLQGRWRVTSSDGLTAQIEMTVESPDEEPRMRRFDLQFEPGKSAFSLLEEGAEIRFGYLHFERKS